MQLVEPCTNQVSIFNNHFVSVTLTSLLCDGIDMHFNVMCWGQVRRASCPLNFSIFKELYIPVYILHAILCVHFVESYIVHHVSSLSCSQNVSKAGKGLGLTVFERGSFIVASLIARHIPPVSCIMQ